MRAKRSVEDNALSHEMKAAEWDGLKVGAIMGGIGSVVFVGAAYVYPEFSEMALLAALMWPAICITGEVARANGSDRIKKVASGYAGESYVHQSLTGMGAGFLTRNQVLIPNKRSRTGHTEADFVVIGKKALYVIEAKNNSGSIDVSESAQQWPVTTPGGKSVTMRNPVRQVQIQAKVLGEELRKRGLTPIIQPMVAFTSPKAQLHHKSETSVPVFEYPLKSMRARIQAYEQKLADYPDLDVGTISNVIDELYAEAVQARRALRGK